MLTEIEIATDMAALIIGGEDPASVRRGLYQSALRRANEAGAMDFDEYAQAATARVWAMILQFMESVSESESKAASEARIAAWEASQALKTANKRAHAAATMANKVAWVGRKDARELVQS